MPTAKHREEAREIVARWKRDIGQVVKYERMEADITTALSSRDREIREVLEGLITYVFDEGQGPVLHWCPINEDFDNNCNDACLAARGLWNRLQS